ncbi:MAG: ABC transporter substrate-binding protein [Acidobacteriota bacterium]|nr:ABC transporter substrate-binding protein [Acidobacteriota bacterium]
MKNPLLKIAALAAAGALALTGCGGGGSTSGSGSTGDTVYKIGISQYVSHPSLDAAKDGFKEALADAGLKVEYDEQNAQADQATVATISNRFASDPDLDLVLAIATPSAIGAAQAITSVPVLFTAVTDAETAELVASNEAPGANVTGTSDMNPVAEQIALVKQVAPDAQTVGIIYSSGEPNSVVQVELARNAAQKEGLTVVEKTVAEGSQVLQAAQTLDVDAIYVPTDNLVVNSLESVLQVAEERKIPVIVGETDSVKRGGLITLGLDYHALGVQTGEMAIRILTEGADPAEMPVEFQKQARLVINTAAAERMGVTLPQSLLDEADEKVS